jgi:hypothetical protein
VPIVEAFYKRVPVLAYAATAVPATMDGAGVLFDTKEPMHVARLMDAILSDLALQDRIVDGQLAALARLQAEGLRRHAPAVRRRILAGRARRAEGRLRFLGTVRRRAGARELRLYRRPLRRSRRRLRTAMIVNQWVPAAHKGDAIGDSARRVRDLLRAMGHDRSSTPSRSTTTCGRRAPVQRRRRERGDLTIFHYALPSPMTEAFAALRRPRPAVSQRHAGLVFRAVRSGAVPPGVARRAGAGDAGRPRRPRARRLRVQPQELERSASTAPASSRSRSTPRGSRSRAAAGARQIWTMSFVNFLFVGRIAPNKKIEDIIQLAELYKRYVDAYYRFIFVGRYDVVPRYYSMIRALMSSTGCSTNASCSPARFPTKSSPSTTATRRSTSR